MANHVFELGRHIIEEFEVDASVQDMINVVYFTGGPTAGVNLLKTYNDPDSLAIHHRGMQRIGDNRVVEANEEAADQISESLIAENNEEVFSAVVNIVAAAYDITTINIGDSVAFNGFTNFINSLELEVVSKKPAIDGIQLHLGRIPYKSSNNNAEVILQIDKLQTLDNPNSPS